MSEEDGTQALLMSHVAGPDQPFASPISLLGETHFSMSKQLRRKSFFKMVEALENPGTKWDAICHL